MDRWNGYQKVEASIVTGGGFFGLKRVTPEPDPRRMTVWLREERSWVLPYGAADQRTVFTPGRIAIEKLDGTVVAERLTPAGLLRRTPDEHPLGRAAPRVFQRRGAVDVPHDALCSGF